MLLIPLLELRSSPAKAQAAQGAAANSGAPKSSTGVETAEKLSTEDVAAKALKYVEDATEAERTDKMGVAGSEQLCSNCRFYAPSDEEWGGCALFQYRLVAGPGWCTAWVPAV